MRHSSKLATYNHSYKLHRSSFSKIRSLSSKISDALSFCHKERGYKVWKLNHTIILGTRCMKFAVNVCGPVAFLPQKSKSPALPVTVAFHD